MIIRKRFKLEGSHVVRGCTTRKCSRNIHGHSYKVDILMEGHQLDNGGMLMDFGLMKNEIKDFIESFDHTHTMWRHGSELELNFIVENMERWAIIPLSPSAEGFAIMFYSFINRLLNKTEFVNGEDTELRLHSICVHETDTGYAQAFQSDIPVNLSFPDFSTYVVSEWKNPDMLRELLRGEIFENPKIV